MLTLFSFFQIFFISYKLYLVLNLQSNEQTKIRLFYLLFFLIQTLIFGVVVFVYFLFMIRIISKNIMTIEYLKETYQILGNPFNEGIINNLKLFFKKDRRKKSIDYNYLVDKFLFEKIESNNNSPNSPDDISDSVDKRKTLLVNKSEK